MGAISSVLLFKLHESEDITLLSSFGKLSEIAGLGMKPYLSDRIVKVHRDGVHRDGVHSAIVGCMGFVYPLIPRCVPASWSLAKLMLLLSILSVDCGAGQARQGRVAAANQQDALAEESYNRAYAL